MRNRCRCGNKHGFKSFHLNRELASAVGEIRSQAADGATEGNCPGRAELSNHDPEFMKTIITGDETWVYGYDPQTRFQSSQWKHVEYQRPKKAQQVCTDVELLMSCLFDSCVIVHDKYSPEDQEYYFEVLCRLLERNFVITGNDSK
ncbi:uncharacterized protein LOC143446129 [Clavelina lepadiformis]|uniref:uncharacterized protein LOC143446129 n=1 Tax=Clavelina lepadiformis TaxID=159417 RepID=UPI00404376AC